MSLLWRLLQQIASWLDECPQVRVERVPPAAKREQIKGQRNPLELEVRFLSTRPLFRQRFSGCIRQSAQDLDRGLIPGGLPPSELSSQSTLGLQRIIALGTPVFYMLHKSMILADGEQAVFTAKGDRWKKWIRNIETGVVITQKHVRVDAAILMMPRQTEFGKMADWPDMCEWCDAQNFQILWIPSTHVQRQT